MMDVNARAMWWKDRLAAACDGEEFFDVLNEALYNAIGGQIDAIESGRPIDIVMLFPSPCALGDEVKHSNVPTDFLAALKLCRELIKENDRLQADVLLEAFQSGNACIDSDGALLRHFGPAIASDQWAS